MERFTKSNPPTVEPSYYRRKPQDNQPLWGPMTEACEVEGDAGVVTVAAGDYIGEDTAGYYPVGAAHVASKLVLVTDDDMPPSEVEPETNASVAADEAAEENQN